MACSPGRPDRVEVVNRSNGFIAPSPRGYFLPDNLKLPLPLFFVPDTKTITIKPGGGDWRHWEDLRPPAAPSSSSLSQPPSDLGASPTGSPGGTDLFVSPWRGVVSLIQLSHNRRYTVARLKRKPAARMPQFEPSQFQVPLYPFRASGVPLIS